MTRLPHPPRPRPPGLAFHFSRALARESRLTPAEQEAKDSVEPHASAARQQVVEPRTSATHEQGESVPLEERLVAFQRMLEKSGWKLVLTSHPLRARLEAFHPFGATVMITADSRRPGHCRKINIYFLGLGATTWRKCGKKYLEYVIAYAKKPRRTHFPRVESKCRCNKKGRYPTQAAATAVSDEIARLNRGELRAYRCDADDRVWHLTSKLVGYADPIPLAQAFPRNRDEQTPSPRRPR